MRQRETASERELLELNGHVWNETDYGERTLKISPSGSLEKISELLHALKMMRRSRKTPDSVVHSFSPRRWADPIGWYWQGYQYNLVSFRPCVPSAILPRIIMGSRMKEKWVLSESCMGEKNIDRSTVERVPKKLVIISRLSNGRGPISSPGSRRHGVHEMKNEPRLKVRKMGAPKSQEASQSHHPKRIGFGNLTAYRKLWKQGGKSDCWLAM